MKCDTHWDFFKLFMQLDDGPCTPRVVMHMEEQNEERKGTDDPADCNQENQEQWGGEGEREWANGRESIITERRWDDR
jgi:hypothetical protein